MHDSRGIDSGQACIQSLKLCGEAFVIDSQEMEKGRMEIANVHSIGNDVVPPGAGFSERDAWFHAASRHPHAEASGMMVTAVIGCCQLALRVIRAAKFATPDHQRVLEHAALLQILQECGGRLIGFTTLRLHAARNVAMVIPALMIELDELDSLFGKSTSEQAVGGERSRLLCVGSVKLKNVFGFGGEIRHFWNARLHPIRHLELRNASR